VNPKVLIVNLAVVVAGLALGAAAAKIIRAQGIALG